MMVQPEKPQYDNIIGCMMDNQGYINNHKT